MSSQWRGFLFHWDLLTYQALWSFPVLSMLFFSTLVQSVCLGFVKNVLLACQTLKAFCLKSQSGWETGTYLEQGGKLSWVLDCWWVHELTDLCLSPLKVKNKQTQKSLKSEENLTRTLWSEAVISEKVLLGPEIFAFQLLYVNIGVQWTCASLE